MIEVWENKFTECPSVQVGRVIIDLGKKETRAQKELLSLIVNNPETVHAEKYKAPLTLEIKNAFLIVLQEEINKHQMKISHSVKISVDKQ